VHRGKGEHLPISLQLFFFFIFIIRFSKNKLKEGKSVKKLKIDCVKKELNNIKIEQK
jgi:hypothetical protein